MKIIFIVVSILAFLYAALLMFAYLFADALMFHPPARTYVKTSEHLSFKTSNGIELTGVFLKNENAKINIFYCHGNGEDLGMVYPILNTLRKLGFNVFSYDYFGYGYSTEKPTEKNLYQSAEDAWKFAKEKLGFAPENTVLMGFSLGSAAVSHISTLEKNWRAMVIAGGIAKGEMTLLPFDIIPWDILNNQAKLKKITSPILLLHGTKDIIVAPQNAQTNFNVITSKKKLVKLEGFGHNDIFASQIFWDELKTFLTNLQK